MKLIKKLSVGILVVFLLVEFSLAAEAEGAHHGITQTQIKNLIWWSVNFIALCIILYKLLKKPIVNFFRERREKLVKEYEELLQKKKEAEARYLELQEKIKNLKAEAEAIYQNYVEQGKRERERILEEARLQAERIKEQARLYIQHEMERAKDLLRRELAEEAVKLAEELLRKNITIEDQKRLFREALEQIRRRSVN